MKIGVIDYGMSNLGSVCRALNELGADPVVMDDVAKLNDAEKIILPGVGSFSDGMAVLNTRGWTEGIRRQALENGKPVLGICLGMQLLASHGTEGGHNLGLDLIPGEVVRLDTIGCRLRIPHMGWNSLEQINEGDVLLAGIGRGTDFYFVHSFVLKAANDDDVLAWTEYDGPVAAVVGRGTVWGTQFHPEKSSKAGFKLLKNFLDHKPC